MITIDSGMLESPCQSPPVHCTIGDTGRTTVAVSVLSLSHSERVKMEQHVSIPVKNNQSQEAVVMGPGDKHYSDPSGLLLS